MFPARIECKRVLIVGMMAACAVMGLHAGEARSDEPLAKVGLKQAGTIWVLDTESEVHQKVDEARRLARQLSDALVQQRGMLGEKEYQETVKELSSQINQFRSELNVTNQQMRQIPRSPYTRRPNQFANNVVADQYAGLMVYRDQLQAEVNQRTMYLNQLKSQRVDPQSRAKIDAEVRDRREALHQAVVDLRRLVNAITEKYAGLAKDPKLKLGPSRGFRADVKLLERLEKESSSDGFRGSAATPAQKSRRLTRGKRGSGAAAGASSPAGPGNARGSF